jgi:hypothetical protein
VGTLCETADEYGDQADRRDQILEADMRSLLYGLVIGGAVASIAPLAACSADIHGNTVDINATVTATTSVDVTNVQPGETMPVHVAVSNVVLVDPNTTPTPDQASEAAFLKFYIDSTSSAAVLVTAMTDVNITIPATEPPGPHKILCQVCKHDGTPTNSTSEIDFTCQGSTTATTGQQMDGGTTTTMTTVEAGASVGD